MARGGGGTAIFVLLLLWAFGKKSDGGGSSSMHNTTNPRTGRPIVNLGSLKWTQAQIRELATAHGFQDVANAVAISWRESAGGYVHATTDTRGMQPDELRAYWGSPAGPELSVGLWQINIADKGNRKLLGLDVNGDPSLDVATYQDPDENAHAALVLSDGGKNWNAWRGPIVKAGP